MRKFLQYTGGIVIAVAGLLIFFHHVHFHQLWREIIQVSPWVVIGVASLAVLSIWLRSVRWGLMLPRTPQSNTRRLFPVVSIGFMLNNILPARLGEAARAYLIWKKNKFTLAESVGSLIVERGIDTIVFISFFFIPVLCCHRFSQRIHFWAIIGLIIFGISCMALLFYRCFPRLIDRLIKKLILFSPQRYQNKILTIWEELLSNLWWLSSFRQTAGIFIFSYLITMCYPLMLLLLVGSVRTFNLFDAMFAQAFAATGAAIPFAPGYVGTLHAMLLKGLTITGLPIDKARAVTILYHAIGFIIITAVGIYFYFTGNVSMKEINTAHVDMPGQGSVDGMSGKTSQPDQPSTGQAK